jgi:protein-L-isoaspartate(D-aspartate) O-methyltransferase
MGLITDRAREREQMVRHQLLDRGVTDTRVLAAFRDVPRELFAGGVNAARAYDDSALPIDVGQTISQPYIVGVMVQALSVASTDRVLEVGSGSGYVTAILSHLAARVHAIEWYPELAGIARKRLERLGIANVEMRVGDGGAGWPDAAPFDVILVSACGPEVPPTLLEQLAPGGRMVIPVGSRDPQDLARVRRSTDGVSIERDSLGSVVFVPLLSRA